MKKNKCQNKIQGSNINSRKIMKVAFILIGIILNFAFVISQESKIKVGVGISVNPIAVVTSPYSVEMLSGSFVDYTPLTTVPFSISIPMEIGNKYRIEPEMGAYSYYGRREYKNIWDSVIYHFKSLVVRFGVGLFYSEKVDSGTHIYGGVRIGINANYLKPVYYSDNTEAREKDYYITPCVGGEYLLSRHFGLGGEAQFQFTFFGNPSYINTPEYFPISDTKTVFKTNALIFVRWYFQ